METIQLENHPDYSALKVDTEQEVEEEWPTSYEVIFIKHDKTEIKDCLMPLKIHYLIRDYYTKKKDELPYFFKKFYEYNKLMEVQLEWNSESEGY